MYIPGASTLANTQQRRPIDPVHYETIRAYESAANTSFHSLQSTIRYQYSHGLSLLNSYTWSHSIDVVSLNGNIFAGQDPSNVRASRGSSDYDRRHVNRLSAIYNLPNPFRGEHPVLKNAFRDWEISGILNATSGAPFMIVTGLDASLTAVGNDRPNLVDNPFLSSDRPRAEKILAWFNQNAFQANTPGRYGNFGRNVLTGPPFINTDFGVFRNIKFSERRRLQFRAEFFNLFNQVNFGNPVGSRISTAFGRITSAASPRLIQFGLKLYW